MAATHAELDVIVNPVPWCDDIERHGQAGGEQTKNWLLLEDVVILAVSTDEGEDSLTEAVHSMIMGDGVVRIDRATWGKVRVR